MFEIDIRRVGFMNSAAPEESLKRLARASANGITDSGLLALLHLTHYAHGITSTLPDIHWSHLDELKSMKLVFMMDDVEIKLV